jgi:hypothetical protein
MKTMSKLMISATEKLDAVSFLLHTIKTDLDNVAVILQEAKQGKNWGNIKPICKQEELFSLAVLPEENETLARLCLNSLVETI